MKQPFYKSVSYAIAGVISCIKKERNMRIHMIMVVVVIICGFLFSITIMEWLICLLLFGLILSLELVNTAIEAVVDLCSPHIHPLAKYAKDVAAGAVLVSAVIAVIIGLIIFVPKFL